MARARVLNLSVVTSNRRARVLNLSVTTEVVPPIRARVLDLSVTTVPSPRRRVLNLSVTTVVALVANAGLDQTADSLQRVFLSGLASGGSPTGYHWEQTSGPAVDLEPSADSPNPSFVAPATVDGTVIGHELTVTNGVTINTSPAPVLVTVLPHVEWLSDTDNEWQPFLTTILDGEVD